MKFRPAHTAAALAAARGIIRLTFWRSSKSFEIRARSKL